MMNPLGTRGDRRDLPTEENKDSKGQEDVEKEEEKGDRERERREERREES